MEVVVIKDFFYFREGSCFEYGDYFGGYNFIYGFYIFEFCD